MTQGTFFKSDQVQNNLNDIFNTYQEIASVTSQLPKFNKQEKLEQDKWEDPDFGPLY